jgi:Na+(H+)/acetate symporter ActP
MVGYPAAVSVPLAFLTMVMVSRFTRPTPNVAQIFARMHVPERLGMGVERVPRG